MGKKPFGPTQQNAQMAQALAMMLLRKETSIDPLLLSCPAHSPGITPNRYGITNLTVGVKVGISRLLCINYKPHHEIN
jgi:hypothetical protein